MGEDGVILSVYFGERDHTEGGLLADALMDLYARAGVRAAVLLRGVEGFGIRHALQTERLLTLSEDLPVVALAIDRQERIDAVLEDVRSLSRHGVITLERARLLGAGESGQPPQPAEGGELKLTILTARHRRTDGAPAHVRAVDELRRHGLAGALVLLGVDGSLRGERHRARLLARNSEIPLLISAVGEAARVGAALPRLAEMLDGPPMLLERTRVCKRDGTLLGDVGDALPPADPSGLGWWQKLVVQTGELTRHEQHPIHSALVRRLRAEGAAGATAMRGQWGFSGDHAPHGERFWSLGRHVPVSTVVLDTPERMRRWFPIVDEVTARTGLVTSELVPALRAAAPGIVHGGLELAAPRA